MKTLTIVLAAALLVVGQTGIAQADHQHRTSHTTQATHSSHSVSITTDDRGHLMDWDDNTWFEIDDGSVIITHKERGEPRSTVEITEDHELYVDDKGIDLDPQQQAMVDRFHDDCMELAEQATKIGLEGAKIGLEGAKLGAEAVAGVFRLILPDYDSDDLEAEMERKAGRIEAKAAVLEEKASEIEDMADDLDDQAGDMRRAIPALKELDWF
jgi:hypothetical protein